MIKIALGVCMMGTIFAAAVIACVTIPIPYGILVCGPALGLFVLVVGWMEPKSR
jgi:hypothetical protein